MDFPPPRDVFKALDKNGDGFLTLEEPLLTGAVQTCISIPSARVRVLELLQAAGAPGRHHQSRHQAQGLSNGLDPS